MQTLSPFDIVAVWEPQIGTRLLVILDPRPSVMKRCQGVAITTGLKERPHDIEIAPTEVEDMLFPLERGVIREQLPQKVLIPAQTKPIGRLTGRLRETLMQHYPLQQEMALVR